MTTDNQAAQLQDAREDREAREWFAARLLGIAAEFGHRLPDPARSVLRDAAALLRQARTKSVPVQDASERDALYRCPTCGEWCPDCVRQPHVSRMYDALRTPDAPTEQEG
jgi:hypothetical protein